MKKITLIILMLNISFLIFNTTTAITQYLTISKTTAKTTLVKNTTINTNADAEMQVSEENILLGTLNVYARNRIDMAEIEAFTTLTYLDYSCTHRNNLNISANMANLTFNCNQNKLTYIDLANGC